MLGRHEQKTDVEFSRHCHEVWSHPSFDDRHALEEALSAFLDERADICHIFPIAGKSISSLLDMPRILHRPIDIAMVPRDLFRACQDKSLGNDLGKQTGFLVPESRVVENLAEMDAAIASIAFPVIVKSLRSVQSCSDVERVRFHAMGPF